VIVLMRNRKWSLRTNFGIMDTQIIGEFNDLKSAQDHALWVERNNKREYQKATDEMCSSAVGRIGTRKLRGFPRSS